MRKLIIIMMISLTALLFGCSNSADSPIGSGPPFERISAQEAYNMMQESDDFILLDVRTPDEYQAQHIEGAILIPVNEIEARAAQELPDKNAVILVYCRSGNRSLQAADILARMGYTHIYEMGGIANWPYGTVS